MPSEKVGFNRCKGEEDTLYLVLSMHRGSANLTIDSRCHRASCHYGPCLMFDGLASTVNGDRPYPYTVISPQEDGEWRSNKHMFSLICEVPGVLEMVWNGKWRHAACSFNTVSAGGLNVKRTAQQFVFSAAFGPSTQFGIGPKAPWMIYRNLFDALWSWKTFLVTKPRERKWQPLSLQNCISCSSFSVIVRELVKILKVEFAGHYVKGTMSSLATWSSIGSFECQHGIQRAIHSTIACSAKP